MPSVFARRTRWPVNNKQGVPQSCAPERGIVHSSVTILRVATCDWHRDGNNAGPTWMSGVGDYTGSELAVMGDGIEKRWGCKCERIASNSRTTLHRSCQGSVAAQTSFTLQLYEHGELRNVQRRPSSDAMNRTR